MSKLLKSSYFFPLQVTIDDREPDTIEGEFRKMGNMIIHRQRLTVGDYLFDGDLLVERKTVADFCCSVKDGRLFKQASYLVRNQVPACVILEGRNRDFKATDFSPKAIQGILLSISLLFRLPVLRTKHPEETAQVMLQAFKQLTRDRSEDQRFYPNRSHFKKKNDPILCDKIHILEGFRGIGTDKAEKLLRKFGNLHAIFTADHTELMQVPGIGKKTVDNLIQILRE